MRLDETSQSSQQAEAQGEVLDPSSPARVLAMQRAGVFSTLRLALLRTSHSRWLLLVVALGILAPDALLYLAPDRWSKGFGRARKGESFRVINNSRALARLADAATNTTMHVVSTCNDAPYVFRERASTGSLLPVDPRATHAMITLADGRTRRQELSCGGGYLSQSSSTIALPDGVRLVTLYNGRKKLKEIRP